MLTPVLYFFGSLALLILMFAVKWVEFKTGKTWFMTRIGNRVDNFLFHKGEVAKVSLSVFVKRNLLKTYYFFTRMFGIVHDVFLKRFNKIKADFLEALREKRDLSRKNVATSIFLKDMLDHKTRLREER